MAFRAQDIPKTTRKSPDGDRRRVYPRFLKDATLLPKIELAISYLDGMVGRRRGDLSSDAVLDLFGDPKLARCLVSCLTGSYRHRPRTVASVVGGPAAALMSRHALRTPADLRAWVYEHANQEHGGFVDEVTRVGFLARSAAQFGLTPEHLTELLHLDAERNLVLVRTGPRPGAADVAAAYNNLLLFSLLRQASTVTLDLPGLDGDTIAAVIDRHEVHWSAESGGPVRLEGRRAGTGSWTGHGARVARCAAHLVGLCPKRPTGEATVHLGDRALRLVLDGRTLEAWRSPLRLFASVDGMTATAELAAALTNQRRTGALAGWIVRRTPEPIAAEGALVLPELLFEREGWPVPAVPVPAGPEQAAALAALERVGRGRPVLALETPNDIGSSVVAADLEPGSVIAALERLWAQRADAPAPLTVLRQELDEQGWLPLDRLTATLGDQADLTIQLAPLTEEQQATFVPGFGLIQTAVLERVLQQVSDAPDAEAA